MEDETEFADLISEGLRDQGMAVDVAYDGLAGASRLNLNPFDVVVLDRDLPGLHGDTLCRMITDSHDPAMILMLTAARSPGERVAGLVPGADDYLPKPFHFPELVLRIRALARRKPAAQDRTLTAAGIELDPLARSSARNDCSSRPGMRTPTHSPTRYASRSAACAASSDNRRSSRTHPASDTASPPPTAAPLPKSTGDYQLGSGQARHRWIHPAFKSRRVPAARSSATRRGHRASLRGQRGRLGAADSPLTTTAIGQIGSCDRTVEMWLVRSQIDQESRSALTEVHLA